MYQLRHLLQAVRQIINGGANVPRRWNLKVHTVKQLRGGLVVKCQELGTGLRVRLSAKKVTFRNNMGK